MTELSVQSSEKLCNLVVATKTWCPDIISHAALAFYMPDSAPASLTVRFLKQVRTRVVELQAAIASIDSVIDELEGRNPVVPVDEQVAA